jgi:hypothetical protein
MPEPFVDSFLVRSGFRRIDGVRAFSNGQVVVSLAEAEPIWSSQGWRLVGRSPERFFVLRRVGAAIRPTVDA